MGLDITYALDDAPYGQVRYWGTVTDEEMVHSILTLVEAAKEGGIWRVLADLTDMVWNPNLETVKTNAEALPMFVDPALFREAMVLPIDVTARLSAEYFAQIATKAGLSVHVFDDRDTAIAWLVGDAD